mmetsp:Transcript_15339/g.57995  ORF Transcript_15339/g.57995 Transcript_15339/m.57995 type:complete len:234 (-) Transcript_15339:645-1346(-)
MRPRSRGQRRQLGHSRRRRRCRRSARGRSLAPNRRPEADPARVQPRHRIAAVLRQVRRHPAPLAVAATASHAREAIFWGHWASRCWTRCCWRTQRPAPAVRLAAARGRPHGAGRVCAARRQGPGSDTSASAPRCSRSASRARQSRTAESLREGGGSQGLAGRASGPLVAAGHGQLREQECALEEAGDAGPDRRGKDLYRRAVRARHVRGQARPDHRSRVHDQGGDAAGLHDQV